MAVTLGRVLRLVSSRGFVWLANRLTPQGCLSNDSPAGLGDGTSPVGREPWPDRWHLTLAADGITTVRGDGPADVTLSGDAADIYLALWNRGKDSTLTVEGDRQLLDLWHNNVRVRWS